MDRRDCLKAIGALLVSAAASPISALADEPYIAWDQWNRLEIHAIPDRVRVMINGRDVTSWPGIMRKISGMVSVSEDFSSFRCGDLRSGFWIEMRATNAKGRKIWIAMDVKDSRGAIHLKPGSAITERLEFNTREEGTIEGIPCTRDRWLFVER